MNKTILSVGSVTHALKAQRLLADIKIHSKLIKLDSGSSPDGCIYGVIINENDYPESAVVLKRGGVSFTLSPPSFPK